MPLVNYSAPNRVASQTGFPCRLTSSYDAEFGYSWEMLVLHLSAASAVDQVTYPLTGRYCFTPDDNQALTSGTEGWMEPDPGGQGWLFIGAAGSFPSDSYNGVTSVSLTADSTLYDIMTLNIPSGGTYLICMTLIVQGAQSAIGAATFDSIKVYPIDDNTGTDLNFIPLVHTTAISVANRLFYSSAAWSHVVVFDAAVTIKCQAERGTGGGGTWIANPSTGFGTYSYTKIA